MLSTQNSGWRAVSQGAVAEPSKSFAYIQSAFRQQTGACIGEAFTWRNPLFSLSGAKARVRTCTDLGEDLPPKQAP